MDFHTTKIWRAFRRLVPFWKIFGNQCQLVRRSYSWLDKTLHVPRKVGNSKWFYKCTNKKIDSHITKIWRAFRRSVPFFWKIFGNRCQLIRGSYFWLRTTWLYTQWSRVFQRKDRLSHYQKLTSLSAFGFTLKDFWKPMSVNARVILLVEDDVTLYTMVTIVSTKG